MKRNHCQRGVCRRQGIIELHGFFGGFFRTRIQFGGRFTVGTQQHISSRQVRIRWSVGLVLGDGLLEVLNALTHGARRSLVQEVASVEMQGISLGILGFGSSQAYFLRPGKVYRNRVYYSFCYLLLQGEYLLPALGKG